MKKLALIGMVWLLRLSGCAAPVSGAAEEDGTVYAAQKLALPEPDGLTACAARRTGAHAASDDVRDRRRRL